MLKIAGWSNFGNLFSNVYEPNGPMSSLDAEYKLIGVLLYIFTGSGLLSHWVSYSRTDGTDPWILCDDMTAKLIVVMEQQRFMACRYNGDYFAMLYQKFMTKQQAEPLQPMIDIEMTEAPEDEARTDNFPSSSPLNVPRSPQLFDASEEPIPQAPPQLEEEEFGSDPSKNLLKENSLPFEEQENDTSTSEDAPDTDRSREIERLKAQVESLSQQLHGKAKNIRNKDLELHHSRNRVQQLQFEAEDNEKTIQDLRNDLAVLQQSARSGSAPESQSPMPLSLTREAALEVSRENLLRLATGHIRKFDLLKHILDDIKPNEFRQARELFRDLEDNTLDMFEEMGKELAGLKEKQQTWPQTPPQDHSVEVIPESCVQSVEDPRKRVINPAHNFPLSGSRSHERNIRNACQSTSTKMLPPLSLSSTKWKHEPKSNDQRLNVVSFFPRMCFFRRVVAMLLVKACLPQSEVVYIGTAMDYLC